MKIIYILPYPRFFSKMPDVGGRIAHVIGVIQALRKMGHHVTILTEESNDVLDDIGDEVICLPCNGRSMISRVIWNLQLVRFLANFRDRFDFAYMRYSVGFAPFVKGVKNALGKSRLMIEVNSFLSQKKPWLSFLEERCMFSADHVLTISDRNAKDMRHLFNNCALEKIIVVTNGVDLERFPFWNEVIMREWNEPVVFGYAGSIRDWYGLDSMVDGYRLLRAENPNVSLNIYGDGPYRNTLENKYKDLEGLKFMGTRKFYEMPEVLGTLDVLIYSASTQSSYVSPIKIFEYMAAGRPVLAARTPQVNTLLNEGHLGTLFEIENPQSFAQGAKKILDNKASAIKMAKLARSVTEESHSWESKCESFLSVVEFREL